MAVLLIPTSPGVPFQSNKVRLEGRDFVFRIAWNQREERWYLTICDEEETPILAGLKLLANWPLLRHYRYEPRLPPGELGVGDLTGDGSPPGLDELGIGKRCELTYIESADLPG